MIAGDDPTLPHATETRGLELDRVGRFLVLDRLGEGGMGVVYSAYDPELDRKVAIKVLRDVSADADARARMQREARAMARLSDPHVVAVHDVGVHDGQLFIAMELIKGGTLRDWMRRTPRTWREIVAAFVDAGKGLAAAHDAGIVHRDFKPENVLVDERGRVRVTDFGLARGGEAAASDIDVSLVGRHPTNIDDLMLTEKGAVLGTPAYMSPEQIMGRGADARSDQFSFCIALWEALHGERPFAGDNLVDLAANVAAGKRRSVSAAKHDGARDQRSEATGAASLLSTRPAWLRSRLDRGLATDPGDRYPSMLALLADLQRDPTRQRRRIIAAGVTATTVLLGVGAWQAWRQAHNAACDARGDEILELWPGAGAARKAEMHEAFALTGKAFAEPTFATTAGMLDDWADQWRESAVDVCRADRDRYRDERTRDLAVECLRERSDALSGLLDVLDEADVATVVGAASAASQVPSPITCRDELSLLGSPRPPAGTDREQVATLRREIAQARALRLLGHSDLALAQASETLVQVDGIGWAPLQAAAGLELALAAEQLDDLQKAEEALRRSLADALRGEDDAVAILASSRLAIVLAALARTKEAGASIQIGHALLDKIHAPAAAERIAETDLPLEVAVWEADAKIAFEENRYSDAGALSRQIHHRLAEVYGEGYPEAAKELLFLGWLHFIRGDVEEAIPIVVEAMRLQQDALGWDHPVVASTMGKLGAIYVRTPDKQEEGRELMERSLRILENTYGEWHAEVADAVGRLAHVQPTNDEARRMFEREIAIIKAIRGPMHPDVGNGLHNLADIDRDEGKFVEAEAKYRRVLTLWETASVPGKAASAHKYLAFALDEQERLEEAERELTIALELQDLALADSPTQAMTWEGLAFVRRKRKDLTGALEAMRRALAILDNGSPPVELRVRMTARTADILLELGEVEEGAKLAERAFSEAPRGDRASLAVAQFILARVRWKTDSDGAAAIALAVQAEANYSNIGDKVAAGLVHEWMQSLVTGVPVGHEKSRP